MMGPEDAILYQVDPDLVISLGIEPPRCERCGGVIRKPPLDWNGVTPLVHLVSMACKWEREKQEAAWSEVGLHQLGTEEGRHG